METQLRLRFGAIVLYHSAFPSVASSRRLPQGQQLGCSQRKGDRKSFCDACVNGQSLETDNPVVPGQRWQPGYFELLKASSMGPTLRRAYIRSFILQVVSFLIRTHTLLELTPFNTTKAPRHQRLPSIKQNNTNNITDFKIICRRRQGTIMADSVGSSQGSRYHTSSI